MKLAPLGLSRARWEPKQSQTYPQQYYSLNRMKGSKKGSSILPTIALTYPETAYNLGLRILVAFHERFVRLVVFMQAKAMLLLWVHRIGVLDKSHQSPFCHSGRRSLCLRHSPIKISQRMDAYGGWQTEKRLPIFRENRLQQLCMAITYSGVKTKD